MFADKYFFVIGLAYLVTFLILLILSLTTWLNTKRVKKISKNMMDKKANTQDEKI